MLKEGRLAIPNIIIFYFFLPKIGLTYNSKNRHEIGLIMPLPGAYLTYCSIIETHNRLFQLFLENTKSLIYYVE